MKMFLILSAECGKNEQIPEVDLLAGPGNDVENNPVGHWPWIASVGLLEEGGWKHLCGATLISDRFFLTAAHCIKAG